MSGLRKFTSETTPSPQCTFWGEGCYDVISVWPRPAKEQRPDVESLEICACSRMRKMKQMKQLENVNSNSQST